MYIGEVAFPSLETQVALLDTMSCDGRRSPGGNRKPPSPEGSSWKVQVVFLLTPQGSKSLWTPLQDSKGTCSIKYLPSKEHGCIYIS